MYISKKAIDEIVNKGGLASFQEWCYDIIVTRLEQIGYKRRSGIGLMGPVVMDGSIYCNESGDRVVVTTQRFLGPTTIIRSIPASSKESLN
jgi:hypothetical protein